MSKLRILFVAFGGLLIRGGNGQSDDSNTVVGLSLGRAERRRGESDEQLMLTMADGHDVLLPLTDSQELLEANICGKRYVGDMDVLITGCEGEDRSITIGGQGSWEYTASTHEFKKVEAPDDEDGIAMENLKFGHGENIEKESGIQNTLTSSSRRRVSGEELLTAREKACTDWGRWSKHDNGCIAYFHGWPKQSNACHYCTPTSRAYAACDAEECNALCTDLYWGRSRDMCKAGCTKAAQLGGCKVTKHPTPTPTVPPTPRPLDDLDVTEIAERQCGRQGKYLGRGHESPLSCLTEALRHPNKCAPMVMYSEGYNYAWGCRCCAPGETSHKGNQNWDLYIEGGACLCSDGTSLEGDICFASDCSTCSGQCADEWLSVGEIATRMLQPIFAAVELGCTGDVKYSQASIDASITLNDLMRDRYVSFMDALHDPAITQRAADALKQCPQGTHPKCASLVRSALANLLLLSDGNADRVFGAGSWKQRLYDELKVIMTDAEYLNDNSLEMTHTFISQLPDHLMLEGVTTGDAITITTKGSLKCDERFGVRDRGINLFTLQVGDATENAFGGTEVSFVGDLYMTVLRHEIAHQFDRVRNAHPALKARYVDLLESTKTSGNNKNWMRLGSGANAFFSKNPQEIYASLMGNQYLMASTTQLQLALIRLENEGLSLPLAWFLHTVDLFSGGEDTSVFYLEDPPRSGITTSEVVKLGRDSQGRIISLQRQGSSTAHVFELANRKIGDRTLSVPVSHKLETVKNCSQYTKSKDCWNHGCMWANKKCQDVGPPAPTPTASPTATPTVTPTATPTVTPTATPTAIPTAVPTLKPSRLGAQDTSKCLRDEGEGFVANPSCLTCTNRKQTCADDYHMTIYAIFSCHLIQCRQVVWHLAPPGATECDYGFKIERGDCLAAVITLAKAAGHYPGRGTVVGSNTSCTGGWSRAPVGCSAQTGGDWAPHFKTSGPVCSHKDKLYQLVCAAEP